ncbi:hypothetical protein KHO57_gp078 [Mycobacterium phage Phabba]|uniref:Uncharacterized protein n=1 Tax=Mycobacterium phage Phabba TaxID=2027899 RepID=A0A249XSD5_9CAUD|nr:hypothetical protein KHO57_gp078 [Mycobacterium phage Phabba]ASZ74653.1 hypothetical protein SEA_PHABBA_78 [Mycobacterium phage Phabba]
MFKNAERDPLAIPTPAQRRSVGPTRRQHFAERPSYEGHGYQGGGFGVDPNQHPQHDEPHDGRYEHSQVQEWPRGSGQGWMPGNGVDSPSHLHPVHGPYTPNPQRYPGPHPTNSLDKPVEKQVGAPMGGPPLPKAVARRLQFEAQEFLAQDHGCDDRSELLYRAKRHASTQTSTWTPEASQRAVQAFVERVAELIPNRPRTAAVAQSPTVEDFDDQLLY